MQCPQCQEQLRIERRCRQVRLRCPQCKKEYQLSECAAAIDADLERELERFPCIIYD